MTVKIDGLDLQVQTSGIVHSSGEDISFVLENEKDNPKNLSTRFVRVLHLQMQRTPMISCIFVPTERFSA